MSSLDLATRLKMLCLDRLLAQSIDPSLTMLR
jgi:hypothetical protein